jgi:hypothetical protein
VIANINAGWETPSITGWGWEARGGAQASYAFSSSNPHSGGGCITFTDLSPVQSDVYGTFYCGVGVTPFVHYELGAWLRGTGVGEGNHFTDWVNYVMNTPSGDYDWQRVSGTFLSKDTSFIYRLNIVNSTTELAMDDCFVQPLDGTVTIIKPAGQ